MKTLLKLSYYSWFCLVGSAYCQTNIKQQINSTKNGTPQLIEFYPTTQTNGASFAPPSATTVTTSSTTSGSVLTTYLKPPAGNTFTQVSNNTDNNNITHTKYQQYYNGIKIEGGVYMVHTKNGAVNLMNGSLSP